MRITAQMIVDSAIRQMQQNRRNLFEAQEAISSGRSFSKPSQNPLGAEREMKLISLLDRLDQFDRSVTSGTSFLQESERALSQVFELLSQAKDLALAQVTATADSVSRDIASQEVGSLLRQLLSEANTRQGDRFIFGGFETGSEPFDFAGTCSGDSGSISIRIGPPNDTLNINFTGDKVFNGTGGGVDLFQTLTDLQTALSNNDTNGINLAIEQLDQGIDQTVSFQAQAGIRLNRLEAARNRLVDTRLQLTEQLAENSAADLAQVAANLVNQQTLFEASLAATAQVLRISFLSFLS